jgi:cytochrome d ubiquinol oxidase subunit II
VLAALVLVTLLGALIASRRTNEGLAFALTASSVIALVGVYFTALYPNVMPSTTDPAHSLTVDNASSTPYTLEVMSWSAVLIVPFVIAYQAWSYWIFRKRLTRDNIPLTPQHGAAVSSAAET